jgi:hypothetical protein
MVCIYFIKPSETDRWIPGDRYIRNFARRILRGSRPGGVEKVFINLCKGLKKINHPFIINKPFSELAIDDQVVVLGIGRHSLEGYNKPNKIVAGIGLMTHPSEWPDLCEKFPVVKYLQHSEWANNVYKPFYGDKCDIWSVGIDTEEWKPNESEKVYDVLIYNKIRWEHEKMDIELRLPLIEKLISLNIKFKEIIYGQYNPGEFKSLLHQSKSMIFLCEHESQGIACGETLAMNIPVFAWENGFCLDPNRFKWGQPVIPATSVPYFDEHCGMKFKDFAEFEARLPIFLQKVKYNEFAPRAYILKHLTLEHSASKMLKIMNEVYK